MFSPAAHAATFEYCVSTVPQLLNAISEYRHVHTEPGTVVRIKLVQGTYLVLDQMTFIRGADDSKLSLLGGYTAGCTNRALNPINTVLDGGDFFPSYVAVMMLGDDPRVLIEGLTLTNFTRQSNPNGIEHEGILQVTAQFEPTNSVATVRYCRFALNQASTVVELTATQVKLINNRITDNAMSGLENPELFAAARLSFSDSDSSVLAVNNTIANNSGGVGLLIDDRSHDSDEINEVSNNILWGNGGEAYPEIQLSNFDYAKNVLLLHGNVFSSISHPPPGGGLFNSSADPLFLSPAEGVYRLHPTSAAINSGVPIQFGTTPTQDLDGNARIIGTAIDRGAFESTIDDRTQFVVTNALDNGSNTSPLAGSLRAGIKAANAAAGPYQIRFALSGSCPRQINMTTPMLDVMGNVTIDGRTQSGWSANTSDDSFNANLCVILNGSGGTPYAFRVPSGASDDTRLTVHGIQFAGFTDAAIRLEAGNSHRISGNQFGAVPFTAANQDAIRVTANARNAFIGAYDDPSGMNVIAGSSGAGIHLDNPAGGSTIANNFIGFQPDGSSNGGNTTGVFLFNSPGNYLQYNRIGFSASNGITISGAGSNGNVVQYNRISGHVLAANQGAGINLLFAAHDNTIGANQNSNSGGNTIVNNAGSGVWISNSGGDGNRVLGNYMAGNGAVTHGLDIDLAAAGPTGNQGSNPATGPNRLQNYPNLTSAIRVPGPVPGVAITATLSSALSRSYRIDVYLADSCDAHAPTRGQARTHLGRGTLTTNSAGVGSSIFTLPLPAGLGLGKVSATATSALGDTSEIGTCISMIEGTPPDPLFADGFEH